MIVEFAIHPVDGSHFSQDVANAIKELESTGLDFKLGPMGTAVEGSWEQVFSAIGKCFQKVASDHERVIMNITVDNRKTKPHHLADMVTSVLQKVPEAKKLSQQNPIGASQGGKHG